MIDFCPLNIWKKLLVTNYMYPSAGSTTGFCFAQTLVGKALSKRVVNTEYCVHFLKQTNKQKENLRHALQISGTDSLFAYYCELLSSQTFHEGPILLHLPL